jgi:hypothetical protein
LTCGSAIALAVSASVLTVGSGVAVATGPRTLQIRGLPGPAARHQAAPVDRVGPVDRAASWWPSPGGDNPAWGPPPPDQGWRGIDDGRRDHQPFNYNGSWVTPVFNLDFNNWGFWFFGIWIPL